MKLFNYVGNKQKFSSTFNNLINFKSYKHYYELFAGSAAIFYNLEDIFDSYTLCDLNPNICLMHQYVKDNDYYNFNTLEQYVFKTFGDIKNNKEFWYNFRNWYNSTHHFTESKDKGAYLIILVNSTINGLMQFGKSGYNASFGNRYYSTNELDYNKMKTKLKKTTIVNSNFKDINILPNSLIFLDPPYNKSLSGYRGFEKNIDLESIEKFITDNSNNDIIYTNANIDLHIKNFRKKEIREIKKTSPGYKVIENVKEFYFTNII